MDGPVIGGRYQLLEQRAIGGMATVWRAVDERTGRQVAVKLLHPHLAADRGARRRLRFEAAALAAIEHPNVVAVRGAVADASGPALIMDWVEGRSLAERLEVDGPLDEVEALAVARDIADGLAAVHEQGIVHRDVKPSNILLDVDGRAHLIDLGIAAESETDALALTDPDGVIGTMRYLAPERLIGQVAVPATDVWGLGAVLYEMVSGVVAFPSATVLERAESGGRLPDRPEGISDATWAILERSLASDPADRYPDAAAMAADLHAGVRPSEVPAGDPWAATTVIPTARGSVGAGALAAQPPPHGPAVQRALPAFLGLGALALVAAVAWSAGDGGPRFDQSDTQAAGPTASPAPSIRVVATTPAPTVAPVEPADGDDEGGEGNGNGRGNGDGGGNGRDNDKKDDKGNDKDND